MTARIETTADLDIDRGVTEPGFGDGDPATRLTVGLDHLARLVDEHIGK